MQHPRLGVYLESCTQAYGAEFLDTDPLGEVHRFSDPRDQEIAGFLAAGLAFGQVGTILKNLQSLWDRLDGQPAHCAQNWSPKHTRKLNGFVHRWVKGADLAKVVCALGMAQKEYGSLEGLFLSGYSPEDETIREAASNFVQRLRPKGNHPQGVTTFFCDPAKGSACKRLNLFLRWMVREKDGLDLNVFRTVSPRQLVMPLDTHVARISRYLGLTQRRAVDWTTAIQVTRSLKRIDPQDPTRFDFSIARLGILGDCPRRVHPTHCTSCSLQPACTMGRELVYA